MIIEVFTCPYKDCVWPACFKTLEALNRTLCHDAVVEAKSKVLDRYEFRPDKKGE